MKKLLLSLFVLQYISFYADAQLTVGITTIAGTGAYAFGGDGGPATLAKMEKPDAVTVDKYGNVYIMDMYNQRVRKISPDGTITSVAGNGTHGFTGDGGPATNAEVNFPTGIAVDTNGNIYIADYNANRIREVNVTTGIINTVAGKGTAGYAGDGGLATAAELWAPTGVCFDKQNNMYIADLFNYSVRKVTPAGIISTVAGVGGSSGDTGDNGPATACNFIKPMAVAVDKHGNIFVADGTATRVRKIDAVTGIITAFAGIDTPTHTYYGDGGPATNAILYYPNALAVDDSDYVYISDVDNQRIRVVSPSGIINTVAGNGSAGYSGDGGLATLASINNPNGVAADAMGNIYIADYTNNVVRKVNPIHCPVYPVSITGNSYVSPCDSQRFTPTSGPGMWTTSGGHTAISDSGWIHCITTTTNAVDTIQYTFVDSCGSVSAKSPIAVYSMVRYDSLSNIHGKKYLCFDSSYTLTDSAQGGIWSVTDTNATITASGKITAHARGADTVKYTLSNSCGITTKTYDVWIFSQWACDSANFVPTIAGAIENDITLFPNPATNTLNIRVSDLTYTSFTITDNLGKLWLSQPINTLQSEIPIRNIPSGLYFIHFTSPTNPTTRKFLKDE